MRKAPLAAALFLLASSALAQPLLRVPDASPHARSDETFGITDVSVEYHRPAVNGRKIFGGLVPYDVIWRAGANQNTLISFSTPVSVEGQPLAAGTYSLFMIPGAQQWTVVFNKFTGGWGTYNYDQAEDVLRVKVAPQTADMQERLIYTFDDITRDGATMNLRWDKTRVPVKLAADTVKLTRASIDAQMRSGLHWQPQAWTEAARFALNNGDPDTALAYVNHSLSLGPNASSLRLKAAIVEKKGDAATAKALRDQAAALAPEILSLNRGYELNGQKKYDEAIAYVNDYLKKYPNSFRAYALLGDSYARKGDAANAKAAFDKAFAVSADMAERVEVQDTINALGAEGKM